MKPEYPSLPEIEGVRFAFIKRFPGYAVASDGTIWSCRKTGPAGKLNRFGFRDKWQIMNLARASNRYLVTCMTETNGTKLRVSVHRIVLEAFCGPAPEGMEACHGDGDRENNSIDNLRWDSRRANAGDRIVHGRQPRGELAAVATMTNAQALRIKQRLLNGEKAKAVAESEGVGYSTVRAIKCGQNWAHISA